MSNNIESIDTDNILKKRARVPECALNLADLKGESGTISFSEFYVDNKYSLFEVPSDVFNVVIAGGSLEIIGNEGQEAVLCTSKCTFSIKKVETSNLVYLIPPSNNSNFIIDSKANAFYELKLTSPKFDYLIDILQRSVYQGMEFESINPPSTTNLLTLDEITSKIQASSTELNNALETLNAIDINGYIRMIDRRVLFEEIRLLIDTIIEQGWSLTNFSEAKYFEFYPDTDRILSRHSLKLLGTPVPSSSDVTRNDGWVLDIRKVAKATAHILFIERRKKQLNKLWPVDDFLLTWATRTPSNIDLSPDLLKGIAVRVASGASIESPDIKPASGAGAGKEGREGAGEGEGGFYSYLPSEELSLDIKTRVSELFHFKQSYCLEEIEPYMTPFFGGGPGQPKTVTEILLKHTRLVDGLYLSKL